MKQETAYDALGEHVVRRSVLMREDAPVSERYADMRTCTTTITSHEGFGEMVSSTDAYGGS